MSNSHNPDRAARGQGFTDFLAVLGGADRAVLAKAKSTKPSFVGLGLVMLATAAVACLSMSFALTGPLKAPVELAVPVSLCWGGVILIIDRYLVKSMQGVREKRMLLALTVPRLLMAAVIGVVVSTPITLRIFEPEILAQVAHDSLESQGELTKEIESTPAYVELQKVNQEIVSLQQIKRGDVVNVSTPRLQEAKSELASATADRDRIQKQMEDIYLKRACEEAGAGKLKECQGKSSLKQGRGPRWLALNKQYNDLQKQRDAADQKVDATDREVTAARGEAATSSQDQADKARNTAQTRLCGTEKDVNPCPGGLLFRQLKLEQQVATDQARADDPVRSNEGLLARLNALSEISSENTTGWLVHLAVILFFFMIEIMPVTVKSLVALGNDHQYDDVADRMRQAELVAARSAYDSESLRISNQDTKLVAIQNDMVQREIELGKLANGHVQREMETILADALTKWSQDVKDTLAANGTQPGSTRPNQPGDPNGLNGKAGRI